MGRKANTAVAEPLVDLAKNESDIESTTAKTEGAELENQVQDDLQKNLDATQLYLSEIGFSPYSVRRRRCIFHAKHLKAVINPETA